MYDDLKKIIQESKYEIFGLRRDDLEYKIGDTFMQILHVLNSCIRI